MSIPIETVRTGGFEMRYFRFGSRWMDCCTTKPCLPSRSAVLP